jgi:hypothetical protein
MNDFAKPSSYDYDFYVHKTGNFVLYSCNLGTWRYTFVLCSLSKGFSFETDAKIIRLSLTCTQPTTIYVHALSL